MDVLGIHGLTNVNDQPEERFLLKNLFDATFVDSLLGAVHRVHGALDVPATRRTIFDAAWEGRELKERMRHITTVLGNVLPPSYPQAVAVLQQASHELSGFCALVLADFVQVYGLDHFETSIVALERFTVCASAEFAVRPFLERYGERMERQMLAWSSHANHHVRRLSSEGIRPRLPWAPPLRAYKHDPTPILPILENLRSDESDYVRRSVANNLNDIAKDHPDLVVAIARRWYGEHPDTDWIVRHACRTLIKRGRQDVLELLGQGAAPNVVVDHIDVQPRNIAIGDSTWIETTVRNGGTQDVHLRLAYAVDFVKANGSTSRKVFSWKVVPLPAGTSLALRKKHRFQNFTTRTHYPGTHAIHVIVNGVDTARTALDLAP